jgi:formyltetrahydrofolate deformylase
MTAPAWILTLDCEDRPGIVAAVSGFLAERDGFILDSQQYADLDAGRFFMRVEFKAAGAPFETEQLRTAFAPVAERFGLHWALAESGARPRILIAVSKTDHLGVEIAGVVSNHETLRDLTEWHGLPFMLLPEGKDAQEAALLAEFDRAGADYLILARYMQILSSDLADRLAGRCINIHHSFLPGFKGARPYHRAHERGVKLIGATAHFVTSDLDEGPIIEQAVERVDHRASVDDMIRIGRDIEAQVLARAVQWVGARRVFLNGNRTIVFR